MEINFYGDIKNYNAIPKTFKELIKIMKSLYPIGFIELCNIEHQYLKITKSDNGGKFIINQADFRNLIEKLNNEFGNKIEIIGIQMIGIDNTNDGLKFAQKLNLSYKLGYNSDNSTIKKYNIVI